MQNTNKLPIGANCNVLDQNAALGGDEEVYYASGERVRKIIENHNLKEERLYLEGNEIYTKTNNGEVEVEREPIHVYDPLVVRSVLSYGPSQKDTLVDAMQRG